MPSLPMTIPDRPGDARGHARTMVSPFLQARYRRIGLVTFGVPAIATVVAIGTVPYLGPPSLEILGLLIAFYAVSVLGSNWATTATTYRAFAPAGLAPLAVCAAGAPGPIIPDGDPSQKLRDKR